MMITCKGCGWPGMTWAEQRRQYGRVIRTGLTAKRAKELMPRCQKCTTIAIKFPPFCPVKVSEGEVFKP